MNSPQPASYIAEQTAAVAAALGSGDSGAEQWPQLYALLWLGGREASAAQLAALCQPSLDGGASSAPERAQLLAELAEQRTAPLRTMAPLARVSAALRRSLVDFYRQPSSPWLAPPELAELAAAPRPLAQLAAQLQALAPYSAELFERSSVERSQLIQLLACLDQPLAGADWVAPAAALRTALAAWQAEWQLPQPAAAGERQAVAALAEAAVQELAALVAQLEGAGRGLAAATAEPFALSQLGHLSAVLTVLATELDGLSFAPSQMLTYIELNASLEPHQREQLMAMLAECDTLLRALSSGSSGVVGSARQAAGCRARRQLAEQAGVSIVGIERLLDHHQLHAIDADLCEQLERQLLQLAAAAEVLDEPHYSAALRHLGSQLKERRAAVDHRLKRHELQCLAELLVALETVLGRQFNGEMWRLAALVPATTEQLRQRAATVAERGWQRVER